MKKLSIILLAFVLVVACKKGKKDVETTESEVVETEKEVVVKPKKITVALNAKSGSNVSGNIEFAEVKGKVSMIGTINGLEYGPHAIHIHESSDCSSDDGKSAGGHWNPTAQKHGKWGDESGYHKGDIGNFSTDKNGSILITFSTDEWCIGCGDDTKDILGKSVIVHSGTDDYKSQPSGAAGTRVSCAGIIQ
mgnify:CR=1 FL=1